MILFGTQMSLSTIPGPAGLRPPGLSQSELALTDADQSKAWDVWPSPPGIKAALHPRPAQSVYSHGEVHFKSVHDGAEQRLVIWHGLYIVREMQYWRQQGQ